MIAAIEDSQEADVVVDYIPWSVSGKYASQHWPLFSQVERQALAAYLSFQIEKFPDEVEHERKALGDLEAANKALQATAAATGS
ncbi:MAG TPA: hypothetical protein VK639_12600 [Terriglobales bacterium]|nr:hypothetical protein [Terriglobales bacterium]